MITKGPPLWPHQRDALRSIHSRRGTLVWAPMGAGKTRIVIDYLQNTLPEPANILVICPLKVVPVWRAQLDKHLVHPDLFDVRPLYAGSVQDRITTLKARHDMNPCPRRSLIAITNYDAVRITAMTNALATIDWRYIILDESHRIKAPGGITSRTIARLCKPARRIIALSGTPMPQGPFDIYAQARAFAPGHFGYRYADFKNRYGVWLTHPFPKLIRLQNQDEFTAKLAKVCFHISDAELPYTLPPTVDQTITVDLPPDIRATYDQLEDDLFANWQDDTITATNALVKHLRLQQITSGYWQPEPQDKPRQIHTEKIDAIADTIGDIDAREPIVIFARFTPEIHGLREALLPLRHCHLLTGARDDTDAWRADPGSILLAQSATGSEGIDLTAARYCIYASQVYSLKDYLQSRARTHRPGQTRPVTYLHILADNTVDHDIYNALAAKETTVEQLRARLTQRQRTRRPL